MCIRDSYLLGVDVMHSIKQLEEDVFSLSLPTAPVSVSYTHLVLL